MEKEVLVRQLEEMEKALRQSREEIMEMKQNYEDLRDRYTQLVGGILEIIERLKG